MATSFLTRVEGETDIMIRIKSIAEVLLSCPSLLCAWLIVHLCRFIFEINPDPLPALLCCFNPCTHFHAFRY